MLKSLTLFLALLSCTNLLAQGTKLDELTTERQMLYSAYQDAENKQSGLFGGRSKEDLQVTVDAVKAILEKDNEILQELKNSNQQSKAELTDKYNELIRENNELMIKNREITELAERHKGWSKENHDMLQSTENQESILLLALFCSTVLAIYYVFKYYGLKKKQTNLESM
jgi:uncharacterized protein YukE